MAVAVTGWCPIHDRVFDSKDGMCPKCGTALVSDDAPRDEHEVVITADDDAVDAPADELKATPDKRSALVGIAAAAVLAFVAGLAFPDATSNQPRTTAPRDVVADINVGVVRRQFDIRLRLESFSQQGRNVVARITVEEGSNISLGELDTVGMTLTLAGGGEFPVEAVPRTTISGFILEGSLLNRSDIPVIGVRLDELQFGSGVDDAAPIDIRGAWPATERNQPRTVRTDLSIHPGDGRTIHVNGLVGWTDRLELGVSIRGARPGYRYGTRYELIADSIYEGIPNENFVDSSTHERTATVRFEDLPARIRGRWELRVAVERLVAEGPWDWSLI